MKNLVKVFIVIALLAGVSYSQKRRTVKSARKAPAAAAPKPAIDPGTIKFRTYTNSTFRFSVTFPDTWLIPDNDFEAYMKSQGYDLSLKAPPGLAPATKNKIIKSFDNVTVLLTAYKKVPGMDGNAVVRISVENLKTQPLIKDGVDYIDLVIQAYKRMSMPAHFKYSEETRAEQLGKMQFAFADTETKDGKRRLYVTVRNGHALLFSISYTDKEDLEVLRQILANGNFALK
jgi:hypothetical protein